ncbi:ATP-binding cassette domain-containing protein [Paenibacillus aurantius]|uniref:ATP-binding cassette domain-containing protein n=1 Tax=Paenibacillus aurantius TaxID=2918900 RepID=A0AA96RGD4_9BACL|nr:ATP-binding cassette domain-containing protein [Paenibacillus aurantius]WNQ09929.1 ATP-binding cassette domain-containing protein [Paenibacillus aurantius]
MQTIRVEALSKAFQVKRKTPGLSGSLRSLFKPDYTVKTAVEPIDFRVEQGEALAFLGPNGAGKSTTIKMLTGILHPSGGTAEVLGFCPWKERKRLAFHVGSVFGQKSQLWYHLPPVDTFELMSRIYELGREDFRKRRDDLIERFDLGPYLATPVRKLSLGERMRCEIAAALLHRPKVVFLDEPTIGLDVVVKQRIRELIREMNREEGVTVFLTSHDAGDIEQLCRRAIVINHGRIILDDTVSGMKRDFLTRKTVQLKLKTEPEPFSFEGVEVLKQKGTGLKLSVDTSCTPIETVLAHFVRTYRLEDVTIENPPMEEIITQIYARTGQAGREQPDLQTAGGRGQERKWPAGKGRKEA